MQAHEIDAIARHTEKTIKIERLMMASTTLEMIAAELHKENHIDKAKQLRASILILRERARHIASL